MGWPLLSYRFQRHSFPSRRLHNMYLFNKPLPNDPPALNLLGPAQPCAVGPAADEEEVPDGEWLCWSCTRAVGAKFMHPTTPVHACAPSLLLSPPL